MGKFEQVHVSPSYGICLTRLLSVNVIAGCQSMHDMVVIVAGAPQMDPCGAGSAVASSGTAAL